MDILRASEVFEVAIKIEENGEKFYRHAATLTEDADTKAMFTHLAEEEVKHKQTFQGMLSRVEDYQPTESYPGEYLAYLKTYAEGLIFSPEKLEAEFAKVTTASDAIDFAIQREIESILYYIEAKNLVPQNQRDQIDRIIEEERRHYLKLVGAKKAA